MSSVHVSPEITAAISQAARQVALLWPLDRAIAVNPLLDCLDDGFDLAVGSLETRLGASLFPHEQHFAEARRRGLLLQGEPAQPEQRRRPGTVLERSGLLQGDLLEQPRLSVGTAFLEAVLSDGASPDERVSSLAASLSSRTSWIPGPRDVRERASSLIASGDLDTVLAPISQWSLEELTEEFARHFARLPGWAAWAKWNDHHARVVHDARLTLAEFLITSLAVDVAWVHSEDPSRLIPPSREAEEGDHDGMAALRALEEPVYGAFLEALAQPVVHESTPSVQIVTCIDVRSEPLRRALEESPAVETFGFAGFFGVFAEVQRSGEDEASDSLPVIAAPTAVIAGGTAPGQLVDERIALEGTLAELTHEPSAMFALAEGAGWLGSPWLVARSLLPRGHALRDPESGAWHLAAGDAVSIAEGALRGMGLTASFASEVVFLGHAARTTANPHFATLECGACAGHGGGPNAAALAGILNDARVREALAERGITIPPATRFLAGEHDTTRERVTLFGESSPELRRELDRATDQVALWRADLDAGQVAKARRRLERRARDWAETRPEWGLADHVGFVVAPRRSLRGVDLGGRSFLHSYDPAADDDGQILASILSAPMVVAHWINAAYYFSSVAPEILGAGDKTLLNPVGDFAVISGDDPDLRLGLPWQSLVTGSRPVHLPVRLLVVVEAPLERIAKIIQNEPVVRQLVEGGWVRLVGRARDGDDWVDWEAGRGWVER